MNALVSQRKNSSAQLKVRNTLFLFCCFLLFLSVYYIRYSEISNPRPECQEAAVACLSQLSLTHTHMQTNALIQMHTQIPVYSCIYPSSPTNRKTNSTTHTQRPLHLSTSLIREQTLLIYLLLLSFLHMPLCYKKQQYFNLP